MSLLRRIPSSASSCMGLNGWLVIVVAILLLRAATTAATVYKVGGSLGWNVPPNTTYYSTWAAANLQTFKLGDGLEFNSTKKHDVMEVSKADYDNCTKEISITYVIEPGSLVTFSPPNGGSYYLISSMDDDCVQGQKFSFNVIGPAQSPTSSASSLCVGALFAVLSNTLIYFFA